MGLGLENSVPVANFMNWLSDEVSGEFLSAARAAADGDSTQFFTRIANKTGSICIIHDWVADTSTTWRFIRSASTGNTGVPRQVLHFCFYGERKFYGALISSASPFRELPPLSESWTIVAFAPDVQEPAKRLRRECIVAVRNQAISCVYCIRSPYLLLAAFCAGRRYDAIPGIDGANEFSFRWLSDSGSDAG
jgi:hypothetical protein